MKKKLLVTTAALSMSLTSVGAMTSYAATEIKTDTNVEKKAEIRSDISSEEMDKQAILAAHKKGGTLERNDISALNTYSQKLGYLKGDKITVPIGEEGHINKELGPTNNKVRFSGSVKPYQYRLHDELSDPTLKTSYDKDKKEMTIERVKNKKSTGVLSVGIDMSYNFKTERESNWGINWDDVSDRTGKTSITANWTFENLEEAPLLSLDSKNDVIEVDAGSNFNYQPEDFFTVKTSAGKVKAEFTKKPDLSQMGEQTATITVWDEYGAEDRNDSDHNITFDVKFNVVGEDDWEGGDTSDWKFYSGEELKIDFDPENGLTNDYVFHSDKQIALSKPYKFETGETYRFTTYIKPDASSSSNLVKLSLKADPSNNDRRELFTKNLSQLPTIEKNYMKISEEFTIESGEEAPWLVFESFRDGGIYIDSFKVEKVK
ncbi:hypothetical protein [Bacillus thuringiensis]|uniref:hypothetical protein n=1 Tax=Bacillus thuringiensis TaxID=1428 RepID=UPI0026E1C118|nr:hypothetical protein [Bacillus thuringiensis]MDO6633847.1 hypothetical protein [Bacillus thuringiensis]MDO6663148.1 hypothetical protein [Bacillus thuringiensis]MDO6704010.1 hypothetical protein [Bacillus thuringiensis]